MTVGCVFNGWINKVYFYQYSVTEEKIHLICTAIDKEWVVNGESNNLNILSKCQMLFAFSGFVLRGKRKKIKKWLSKLKSAFLFDGIKDLTLSFTIYGVFALLYPVHEIEIHHIGSTSETRWGQLLGGQRQKSIIWSRDYHGVYCKRFLW